MQLTDTAIFSATALLVQKKKQHVHNDLFNDSITHVPIAESDGIKLSILPHKFIHICFLSHSFIH